MDILNFADIFMKYAQLSDFPERENAQLHKLSDILASQYPRDNLQSGLISLLKSKIDLMEDDVTWQITTSSPIVENINNLIKSYYLALKRDDLTNASVLFKQFVDAWDNYKRNYFNDTWLYAIQGPYPEEYEWWRKLRQKINDTIDSIEYIFKY